MLWGPAFNDHFAVEGPALNERMRGRGPSELRVNPSQLRVNKRRPYEDKCKRDAGREGNYRTLRNEECRAYRQAGGTQHRAERGSCLPCLADRQAAGRPHLLWRVRNEGKKRAKESGGGSLAMLLDRFLDAGARIRQILSVHNRIERH